MTERKVCTYQGLPIYETKIDGETYYFWRNGIATESDNFESLSDAKADIRDYWEDSNDGDYPFDHPRDELDYEWNQPGAPFRSGDY